MTSRFLRSLLMLDTCFLNISILHVSYKIVQPTNCSFYNIIKHIILDVYVFLIDVFCRYNTEQQGSEGLPVAYI